MEGVLAKKKKSGRPVKQVKKEIRAAVRFSKTEYFIIKQKAAKAGINPSMFIRTAALHVVIKARLTPEESQFLRQLIGISSNLNQVAKQCHKEGVMKALLYFETFRNEADELLKKLHRD